MILSFAELRETDSKQLHASHRSCSGLRILLPYLLGSWLVCLGLYVLCLGPDRAKRDGKSIESRIGGGCSGFPKAMTPVLKRVEGPGRRRSRIARMQNVLCEPIHA